MTLDTQSNSKNIQRWTNMGIFIAFVIGWLFILFTDIPLWRRLVGWIILLCVFAVALAMNDD